jgi:hypothetical protein
MYRVFGTNTLMNKDLISENKITFYNQKLQKGHIIRTLRKYTKVIIFIHRTHWTSEKFITEYYSADNRVIIRDYIFKLLDSSVIDTKSLTMKMFREEQVADYYKDYLLKQPVIVSSLSV